MNSWKTTVSGLIAALVAIGNFVNTYLQTGEMGDVSTLIMVLLPSLGLILARDNNVTSEEAGAGKGGIVGSIIKGIFD